MCNLSVLFKKCTLYRSAISLRIKEILPGNVVNGEVNMKDLLFKGELTSKYING